MKIIACICVAASLAAVCFGAESEPQNIPLSDVGRGFRLVGKLHVPLGDVVTLKGVVVQGPWKGDEGGFNLRVQSIQGRATQEDIQTVIRPFYYKWGEKDEQGNQLPELKVGSTYEMEGYSTGGYAGIPGEVLKRKQWNIQQSGYHFREEFVVTKAKPIEPIAFVPWMFTGQRALLQGLAETREGKALLIGKGWTVMVLTSAAWPKDVEGKQIETLGMYNEVSAGEAYQLVDGEWRLVLLKDQVEREVKLRGRALSSNGVWWFQYRGIDLYVENITNLPGWTDDNHWRPMEIRGRLEKAALPRLDQLGLKSDRDLRECFIVRGAAWTPLPSLLSLERPFFDQGKPQ